jgi:hypothetical protein
VTFSSARSMVSSAFVVAQTEIASYDVP